MYTAKVHSSKGGSNHKGECNEASVHPSQTLILGLITGASRLWNGDVTARILMPYKNPIGREPEPKGSLKCERKGGRTMGLINKVHPLGAISINGNGPRLPNNEARPPPRHPCGITVTNECTTNNESSRVVPKHVSYSTVLQVPT